MNVFTILHNVDLYSRTTVFFFFRLWPGAGYHRPGGQESRTLHLRLCGHLSRCCSQVNKTLTHTYIQAHTQQLGALYYYLWQKIEAEVSHRFLLSAPQRSRNIVAGKIATLAFIAQHPRYTTQFIFVVFCCIRLLSSQLWPIFNL